MDDDLESADNHFQVPGRVNDAWHPALPRGWSTPPVGANFEVQLGKMLNPEARAAGATSPYLRNVNVQWDRLELTDLEEMHFDAADRVRFALRSGDLLVCEGGEVGRSAVWHDEVPGCYYQKALHRVRPYRDDSTRFLMYVLWAASSMGVFENEGNTNTIVHLTAEKLRAHRFPWPHPAIQRAIADYLDAETTRIDAMAIALKRLGASLGDRWLATLDRAVLGADQVDGLVRMEVAPTLQAVPSSWRPRPLRSVLASNSSGVWGSDPTGNGDVPVVRSTEISMDGSWSMADPAFRSLSAIDRAKALLAVGDIVVVTSSGSEQHIGKAALVDADVARLSPAFSNFTQRLRVARDAHPRYVWYFLRSHFAREQLRWLSSTTTGLRNLSGALIGQVRFPGPPLAEQHRIASGLDSARRDLDRLEATIQRQIDLLLERRQALITAAVSGQIDIPGLAA